MSQNPKMDFMKGNFYEKIGKSDLALQKFIEAAESGYDRAQLILGQLYCEKKDFEKAEYWYKEAFIGGVDHAAFNLGNMYYNNEIYETSLHWYEQAAQKGIIEAKNNMGVIFFIMGDYELAEIKFKEVADEGFAKAYFNLGLLNDEMGNYSEAEKMYREGANKNDEDAMYNLAVIEMERGNYVPSSELFKKLIKKKNLNACINLGIFAEISQNEELLEDAQNAYLVAADAGESFAQYRLGYLLAKDGKETDAIHYLQKAVEQGNHLAAYRLGNLYNHLNDMDNARVYFKIAAKAGCIEAKNNLGCIYFEQKKYKEAGNLFKEAMDEGSYSAAENLGDVCRAINDDDLAIHYYETYPNTFSAQIKLATIYEKRKDTSNMVTWFKKAADNRENYKAGKESDFDPCCKLAKTYEAIENYDSAIRYYKIASEHGHNLAKLYLGRLYFQQENYEEAEKYFRDLTEISNVYVLNTLGIIYENFLKETKKAIDCYEKAVELNCTEAMYNLSQLLFRNYENEKGKKYLKMGAELGNKQCEYFLAAYYFNKSMSMFRSLANVNYANSFDLIKEVKNLEFMADNLLMCDFDTYPLEYKSVAETYAGVLYIEELLEGENLTLHLRGKDTEMAVDQGEVDNIDV